MLFPSSRVRLNLPEKNCDYSKKVFVATRIQKSLISIRYYQRNNLDGILVCTRFSFSTKQLLWRGTCLANHCKSSCSLRRITSKDLWTNFYGSHPLGFLLCLPVQILVFTCLRMTYVQAETCSIHVKAI